MAMNTCRKKLNLPQNKKILFTVGRFVEKKGFEYLIDAMSKVKTKNLICGKLLSGDYLWLLWKIYLLGNI